MNLLALTVLVAGSPPMRGSLPLRPIDDVPLPGHASRFDYQAVDPVGRRLYVAHLGDSSLLVFDLDGKRVIHEVPGPRSVHGVIVAPDQHLVLRAGLDEPGRRA